MTTATPILPKFVGAPIRRREDPRLIQGGATYVDDVRIPGALHAAFVRSAEAHARLTRVDTAAAEAAPGVVAVLTAADLDGAVENNIAAFAAVEGMTETGLPLLATDTVRCVGEAIACVVAEDPYQARDAVDLVEVDYDPLPVVVNIEQAMEADSPLVHESMDSNVSFRTVAEQGDIEAAIARADRVVKLRLVNQRLLPLFMEPRCLAADYNAASGQLTIWATSQFPHLLRTQFSKLLGIPEHNLRLIVPEVGGGFGAKANFYPDEVLTGHLAVRFGRPVKWVEDRSEDFLTCVHGRDQIDYIEAPVSNDGKLLGLRLQVLADLGAYQHATTPAIPGLTAGMGNGCYDFQDYHAEVLGIYTHKMATAAYRGAGRPEATYLIERTMDAIAAELNLDPAEVRRRNFIQPDQFPYTTPPGNEYDSGDYDASLDRALEMVDYDAFRREQAAAREQGRYLGLGLSSYVEICGFGPSKDLAGMGGWESATVRVDPNGNVTVLTGTSPHGQGQETSFAQMVADQLGVPLDDIVVLHGDTGQVQYGVGTFGSRGIAVGGPAVHFATEKVRDKVLKIAAHLLEAAPEDVDLAAGQAQVRGAPGRSIAFADVAAAAITHVDIPEGMDPGLEFTHFYDPPGYTFPFGTHACIVEVDAETGQVEIKRYVAVDDCGKAINPKLVDGQVHGGLAQGIAQALYEEIVFDPETGQLLTGSLMDYAAPKAGMLPSFETDRTETPTPNNILGAKGVGEAGTIGSTPAVVNAVIDAVRPLGVAHLDMPLKPERIWQAIQQASA